MSSNPAPFLQAARRYGSQPSFDSWARRTYGVSGPALLAKVAKGESGFNMAAVSSAGARGGTQFMPATREEFVHRYGVDPWASPDQAVHATELYLEHDKRGLAGYNPGDPSYTRYILGQKVGGGALRGSPRSSPAAPGPRVTTRTVGGTDNSKARGALIASFVQGGDSQLTAGTAAAGSETSDPLKFALGLRELADIPGHQVATPSPGRAPSEVRSTRTHAKPGVPVAALSSEGGQHQTDGLPGYPARDYFAPAGSRAVAPVSGRVVRLSGHDPAQGPTNGPHGPLGWSVYIQGADGRTYFLTHMGSRNVKVGETVQQGQAIGTVANYDKYGTPSHIHMGVHG